MTTEIKEPKSMEKLRRLIHKQAESKKQQVLEIAKAFEEVGIPRQKIAARVIHDLKKELKDLIDSLQAELNYLEEERLNMKRYVN